MTEKENWLNKLRMLCSKKEMCKSEVMIKLSKSHLSQVEKDSIVEALVKEKFIDEKRYVQAFIHDKLKFNGWGKQKIKYALLHKNISESLFEEIWKTTVDNEIYLEKLIKQANTKLKTIKATDEYERKRKLVNFLLQRGVDYETIEKIWSRIRG